MKCLADHSYDEVARATGVTGLLDTAYTAFLAMLADIQVQQDRHGSLFEAFVIAGGSAAQGRFALVPAPSLPAAARARQIPPAVPAVPPEDDVAAAIARLSELLARRLGEAAALARHDADRQACAEAARHARALTARFDSGPP